AGAVGAEEAVDLAAVDAQGDLVQGAHLAEVARDGAYLDAVLLAHGRSCTVAAMPGLSSPLGSISTFTPNTRSLRWSRVWMLRGVYSARSETSTMRPGNRRFGKVSTVSSARSPTRTRPSLVS